MSFSRRTGLGILRVIGLLWVVACLALPGCKSKQASKLEADRMQRIGPGQVSPDEIQSELMSFADTYSATVGEALLQLQQATDDPVKRAFFHDVRLNVVQNVIIIAAGSNPVVSLLDMTVTVTLQRTLAEEYWRTAFGPEVIDAIRLMDEDVWQIAARAMSEEEQEGLRRIIDDVRERYGDFMNVAAFRASDFARERQRSFMEEKYGKSILALFYLDPLQSLNPASREIAQSRLLGERMFFYLQRTPDLLRWQLEGIIFETAVLPEVQEVVEATERISQSTERASLAFEDLPDQLAEKYEEAVTKFGDVFATEREEAVNQFADRLSAEREAAINQFYDGLTEQRDALFGKLDADGEELRTTLGELRSTIDSGTAMSDSLQTTVDLMNQFNALLQEQKPPDAPPFDIAEYRATVEAAERTITELNALLASPALSDRTTQVHGSLAELIDLAFIRALIVVAVAIGGALIAAISYRLVTARVSKPAT